MMKSHVKLFQQRVRKQISSVAAPLIRYLNRVRFECVAPIDKVIWIKLEDLFGWYGGNRYDQITFRGQIKGGEWSGKIRKREQVLNKSCKHHAVIERYQYGEKWGNTRLFTDRYAKDYQNGMNPQGMSDLDELEKYYEKRYDSLFATIKVNGILPANEDNPHIAPIFVHIDKDGELLYTVDGNHRLAMCKVLKIKKIPVQVWMRHREWQEKREIILGEDLNKEEKRVLLERYKQHPDIVSELIEEESITYSTNLSLNNS